MITAKSKIAKKGNGKPNKKHAPIKSPVIEITEMRYPKTERRKMGIASAVNFLRGNLNADSKRRVGRKTKKMSSGDSWNSLKKCKGGSFWIIKERIIPTSTRNTE